MRKLIASAAVLLGLVGLAAPALADSTVVKDGFPVNAKPFDVGGEGAMYCINAGYAKGDVLFVSSTPLLRDTLISHAYGAPVGADGCPQ